MKTIWPIGTLEYTHKSKKKKKERGREGAAGMDQEIIILSEVKGK